MVVSQEEAKESGMEVVTGELSGVDRHPATIPDAQKQKIEG